MATYSKKKLLVVHASEIQNIADAIRRDFEGDGFEVQVDNLLSGGKDISITKGGMFKAVLGMRSALKISLVPQMDGVLFDANVGIYGQQAIPTVITLFIFWPVLITQIWGLVQQAKLDDRALAIAERVIVNAPKPAVQSADHKFCTSCGMRVASTAKFCPECGTKF